MFRAEVDIEGPPPIKIDKILIAAADHAATFRVRRGLVVTDDLAAHWASQVAMAMDASDAQQDQLRLTFSQYVGTTIDDTFIKVLSMQLAARWDELDRGMLLAYDRPTRPEWVALEVTAVGPAVWRDDKPGVEFTMNALTGHPAGHVLRRKFPRSWLSFLAYRVGFTRRVRYEDEPRIFIGLRFLGYLRPREDSNELDFEEWRMTPKLKKHNTTIINLRTRFEYDKAECPFTFDHQCSECTKELSQCPASYLRTS